MLSCSRVGSDINSQVEVALEITSDQTVPDKWDLWSDSPRPNWPLIRRVCARRSLCARSALEVASDQTSSRPKWPLIRQVPYHCPDEFQTIVQTKVRSKYCPRLKCARNHLWSENDFEHEQISQYRYNIFISSIILSILYSTNKKTNPESIVNESKSKTKWSKKLLSMPFFYAFNWKNELRQLCIKSSWSTLIQNLFVRWPAFVGSWTPWFWSNPSDTQMEFCSECCYIVDCYQRQQLSVKKT